MEAIEDGAGSMMGVEEGEEVSARTLLNQWTNTRTALTYRPLKSDVYSNYILMGWQEKSILMPVDTLSQTERDRGGGHSRKISRFAEDSQSTTVESVM